VLHFVTLESSSGIRQTITTTAEHPVYTLGKGWIAAGKLAAGDQIQEASGEISTIACVRSEKHLEGVNVYNLRVNEAHTYFVRSEGSIAEPVWVHNSYESPEMQARAQADAEYDMRFDEEMGSDAYEGHHSDAGFMGGDPNQKLTVMEESEHDILHSMLNDHLEEYADDMGNTMRPGSTNNAEQIQLNFTREERLQAMGDFYNRADVQGRFPEAANDFFAPHPELED
jgi:hypothetical protein